MLKSSIALALILSASVSFADSARPFSTQNLECEGNSKTGDTVNIKIKSARTDSEIVVRDFEHYPTEQLSVVSEGSVYIQKVYPRRFNLNLFGPTLTQVLTGPAGTTPVTLTGRVSFQNGQDFDLTCKGDLTTAPFKQQHDDLL